MILVSTALLTGLLLISPVLAFGQRAVFLVRHAERQDSSPDSPLSQAGKARAEHLALLLQHSGINAIYTSELQRTIMTAEPLATALKITPVSIPRTDVKGLFQHIRSRHSKDDVVLVISHHKNIPLLIKLFGHQRDFLMEWHEYDNLLVVIPNRDQEPTLLRLHY
jgi:broad specificity phosphatase PhoE